jgi:chemotaxis protein CheD
MTDIVVDIADMKVAKGEEYELTTCALGSCIGVSVYDPVIHVGGLLLFMLPEASINPEKARENPFMFADTGIPLLFRQSYKLGAARARLQIKLAGGADVMDETNSFNIGKRNYLSARKLFYRNNLLITSELVGGVSGKNMRLNLQDGRVEVKLPNGEVRVI